MAATLVSGAVFAQRAAQDNPLRQAARLDAEQQCGEAERFYQQVLAQRPALAALLE